MYTIQGSDQNHYGPVQLAEVLRWIQNGRANAHTLVLKQGETDWKPLSEHSEFADALAAGASPNMQSQIADGQRPKSPKVFGIINIVFGVLCGLCTGLGLLAFLGVAGILENEMGFSFGWSYPVIIILSVVGMLANFALLISGIGLLTYRNWGRTLSNVYSVVAILYAIVTLVLNLFFMPDILSKLPDGGEDPVRNAGNIIGSCISLIYPIILLVFLNKSEVKECLS